ncbi:hypothetical protein FNF29_04263 [Cafeteria roenbergensis]|uniref:Endonuclease/exonuclease/phosphatase domain-containing protein n=1 Tax=Cafeteria roenbergensis TaxID=33653 RepID=A0A5A8CGT7_CAFRO|nr:hypothetical protein FNF29_04263 [Cafeteria roenbergensis]|eukprot:KAA0151857.1 hypothetical protein FNF29_04263 [Cafeteria roenbergensis]
MCDNYAPTTPCWSAPGVGVPGVEYADSRLAYGHVLEGHRPFRLDHPAMAMIQDYAVTALRDDISRAQLSVLGGASAGQPVLWGTRVCSVRSLELQHTVDGTTGREQEGMGGRRFPVLFGVTLHLQIVSAWHPAARSAEEEEATMRAQTGSWWWASRGAGAATGDDEAEAGEQAEPDTPGGVGGRPSPWAPRLWLAHRMDVSFDPSRSFSLLRHTWRAVGGGSRASSGPGLMQAAAAAAERRMRSAPEASAAGNASNPAADEAADGGAVWAALGLDSAFLGANETHALVAATLKGLCRGSGGVADEAEAAAAAGAGTGLWGPDGRLELHGAHGGSAEGGCGPDGSAEARAQDERGADAEASARECRGRAVGPSGSSAEWLVAGTAGAPAPDWMPATGADGAVEAIRPGLGPALVEALVAESAMLRAEGGLRPAQDGPTAPDATAAIGAEEDGAAAEVAADGSTAEKREAAGSGRLPGGALPPHICPQAGPRCVPAAAGPGRLRVATFNAWNSNPPSWLYPSSHERWQRYQLRMDAFAALLLASRPAIVGLQEVRLDVSLGPRNQHGQMRHIAERMPGYQYVAQPATVYAPADTTGHFRDEEGVAIASLFPIVSTNYAVLSRDAADRQDEHTRVCLHAVVATDDPVIGLVDVYSVHMPLSEAARNRTTIEVERFIAQSRAGSVQLLLGDMNEEPHNASMRFWSGSTGLLGAGAEGALHSAEFAMQDAWLMKHSEPEPRSADPGVRQGALTFPSDDPQKRIDTAFVSAWPPSDAALAAAASPAPRVAVTDAWLIGQDPVPSAVPPPAEHVGMVHSKSPLWASDHRGVVFDFEFRRDA